MVPETQTTINQGINLVVDLRNRGSEEENNDDKNEERFSEAISEKEEADQRKLKASQNRVVNGCGKAKIPKQSKNSREGWGGRRRDEGLEE
ncbi:hypothetical protein Q3G72_007702 [Acer saccharum]|nr:hypothetical protein Q3G72_007702 [Acer saccharum]